VAMAAPRTKETSGLMLLLTSPPFITARPVRLCWTPWWADACQQAGRVERRR
jgi:hypothetical protein